MSRSKGLNIKDQQDKLVLAARKLDWNKNVHWQNGLGVGVSAISNWRRGFPIGFENLERLARLLDLEIDFLVESSVGEFAQSLGLQTSELQRTRAEPKFFSHTNLSPSDKSAFEAMRGNYIGFFIAREGNDLKTEYLASERFRIGYSTHSSNSMSFEQLKNQIVGETAVGSISVINERAVGYLTYRDYFPPSLYCLIPFLIDGQVFLVGIYTDITGMPDKEVFSTKIILFPDGDVFESINPRVYADHAAFLPIFNFLDSGLGAHRKRLVVEPSIATKNEINGVWQKIGEAIASPS